MASKSDSVGVSLPRVKEKARVASDLRFDWMMVVVSVWWLGGLFIDGWAHSNIPQLGTFTFMLGLNGALMVVFYPGSLLISVPTALLGGLAADIMYRFVQPSPDQPTSVRLFAFAVPLMFYTLYFIDLQIVGPAIFHRGILWSAPFWAGAPVMAGIAGFLLSVVMIPPAQAVEKKE